MMINNTTAAAEGQYTTAKTSIWWDIENCQVPKGWDAYAIAQKLSSELMILNYNGPLCISSYGNTNLIPNSVQQALSSTGISLNHVPSGRKDASDKKILVDLFLWVLDNPPPANIMLISGDGDFSYALHRLRMMRYNILLAHTQNAPAPLVASAKTTWLWRSLLMANGCESDISSEDVSEHVLFRQQKDSGSSFRKAAGSKTKGIYVPKESIKLLEKERKRKKLMGESAWFCKICNVSCKCLEIFTTHLSSKEHSAHVLADAKNIEKESGQANDIQSRNDKEFKKSLEKQNKELMETSTISERSGGEFWIDFKERLESDVVASLNVDSVFSELSRNSLVPKEMRECFEAILKKLEHSQNEIVIEKLKGNLKQGPSEHLEEDMNKNEKKKSASTEVDTLILKQDLIDDKKLHEEIIRDIVQPKEMTEELLFQPGEALESIDCLEKQNKELKGICAISGRSVKDIFQSFQEVLESENKFLPIEECIFTKLNPEFSATKEARKLDFSSQVANLTRESHLMAYVCSVICICLIVFASHLLGRKNASRVKKHAEVLFDDKKILEESLEKKDHQMNSLEELQYQPKEAQEERVDSESEHVPSAEFSEPKESRDQIDSFAKSLELSLEDKSKQTRVKGEKKTEDAVGERGRKKNGAAATHIRFCDWCNVKCGSQMDFDSHLSGKKHAATVKSFEISIKDISKEAAERRRKKKNGGDNKSQIRVCDLGNVMCTSQMNLDSHLRGQKHVAVVKKQRVTKVIYVKKNGP